MSYIRMAPKLLDYELLNENVKKVTYAVKGELYLRASELQKEGKKVVALCQAPFLLDDPNVGLLFPVDVIARAKHYLSLNSGGLGLAIFFMLMSKYCFSHSDKNLNFLSSNQTGDLEGIEKYSKRTVKVTKQHNEDCKRLLRLMGVPTIEAPCEAEVQCAALCKSDKVFAVASENMDTLTFGVPRWGNS
ncbi:hypothetical protein ZIOFF_067343 [Zingiber officinale]|uniref:XPG-I domain-containing protein n=1 Tax=Zingiber officinale TaxID=94328 RepID=A0A8J5C663_ZINOF|nr:hypothetical protein ZIOFF_067343 [Zingiber officinale]